MNRSEPAALVSRRGFLRIALPIPQDSLPGRGPTGTLRDPAAVGRPRPPTDVRDDAAIQAIEQRLACSCGCTLDVFTCRTTDFTCTYSPELHREVLALRDDGKTAQEILDTFVAKYGEKALMAPKPQGFNLAGYLLPGALIAAAAAGLVLFIGRRKAAVSTAGGVAPAAAAGVQPSPEELERLRRALADIEN
ncbi:MAG: cytochrome c-type biogenesis protein CcmH [Gemmatimonadota bacterium]|nr:cytochrome c-type biogenesis protein CcmH [Gemmatimonadota bacterium]